MIVASARKRGNLLGKRECGVKNEAEVFGRGSRIGCEVDMESEGLSMLEVCRGRPMRRNSVFDGFRVR